jgi:hypothetical protein
MRRVDVSFERMLEKFFNRHTSARRADRLDSVERGVVLPLAPRIAVFQIENVVRPPLRKQPAALPSNHPLSAVFRSGKHR